MGESFWMGTPPGESKYDVGGGQSSIDLRNMMMNRAMGSGPSAAELMMNRGMGQQIAAGRSMAAGARGVSPGMAMREAGQREASAMSNVGQQAGIMRAQEQAQAQQLLAQYLQEQERMKLEQDMYNAARQQRSGMLGPILSTAGTIGGAILGGPMGAAIGGGLGNGLGSIANTPNAYGGYGSPSWADKGF